VRASHDAARLGRRRLVPALAVGVAAAVAALTASTVDAASQPPINIAGLQGAIAQGGPDFMEGMRVAAWAINRAGGVNGRKIKLNVYSTGGTPEGAASAYRQSASNQNNLGAFLGAAGGLAVRALSGTVKMPFISASGNDAIDRPVTKYVFSNSAGAEYATSSVHYAFSKLGAKSFAVMHYDTDFSSQIEGAIKNRCKELGCTVTDVESASAAASVDQLIPQLTKMKNSNPDAYYIESLNPNAMAAARQLGMFDRPVIAEQWLTVPAVAQACAANCEGVVFGAHKCVVRDLLPASQPVVQICKQYVAQWNAYHKGKVPYSQFSIYGRDAVYTYAFAAKKVLDAHKPLTRDNIVNAMEHFKGDITTTHGKLFTSPTNHRLTGTWTEAYVDTTIKMVDGKPTWVLAPKADVKGSTP
jgi:branched-chain amino acid transport system substrate-binding protein